MMKNTLTTENCSIKRVCVERFEEKIDHQLGSGNRKDTITQLQKKNNTRNQWNLISSPSISIWNIGSKVTIDNDRGNFLSQGMAEPSDPKKF